MKKLHLSGAKNRNMVFCIGVGLLTVLMVTAVLMILLTSLIRNEKIDENGMIGVFLIRVIAMLIGGLIGMGVSDRKFLPVICGISAGYLLFLFVMGIILFDGTVYKLWVGVLSVIIGAVIALLVKLKPQTTRKKSVRYAR